MFRLLTERGRHTQFLRLGADILAQGGYEWKEGEPRAVRLTIESLDQCFTVRVQGAAERHDAAAPRSEQEPSVPQPSDRPTNAPASWKWFSAIEEAVIRACLPGEWRTAEQIANATGEELGNHLRAVLRNLTDRCVLRSCSRGYQLLLAPEGPRQE